MQLSHQRAHRNITTTSLLCAMMHRLLRRICPIHSPEALHRLFASPQSYPQSLPRPFTTTSSPSVKALPPRPKPPPDSEIEEFYLKGSGPGGQKINKTDSAVQLRHKPTGLVVKCQATRSREQNRSQARRLLADKIDQHLNGEQSREAHVGRIKQKKSASADKKKRRKYKKLDEEKAAAAAEEEEQIGNVVDETHAEQSGSKEVSQDPISEKGEPEPPTTRDTKH